jgi:hypothetical protein
MHYFICRESMFEVSLNSSVFEGNLVKHIIQLTEKLTLGGVMALMVGFILLLDLVEHSCHDGANTGRFGFHFIYSAVEMLEVPLFSLVVYRDLSS